jgi:hypothetical protein
MFLQQASYLNNAKNWVLLLYLQSEEIYIYRLFETLTNKYFLSF